MSLDSVVATMRQTGADMQSKYKGTSLGAANIMQAGRAEPLIEFDHVVHALKRPTILPPELFARYERDAFWKDFKLLPPAVKLI